MVLSNQDRERLWQSSLSFLYTITYLFELACLQAWIGLWTLIFLSLFMFGLPIILMGLPAIGMFMFKAKRWWSVLLSYLCSLAVCPFLMFSLEEFPLKRMVDEAPHYETLSVGFSIATIFSLACFFIIATVSMIYCLKTYNYRFNND